MATQPTIIRTPRGTENPYFQMARKTAQDRSISFEARGMLAYLLSKPNDWEVMIIDLQQECGRDRVYRIIKELIKHGYMTREQIRDEVGQMAGTYYLVHETPIAEKPDTEKPDTDKPTLHIREKKQNREKDSIAPKGESVKQKPRDVIFDAIAKGSWNISDTTKLDKRSSGRIGMVSSWVKKQYPDCTPDMIAQFYRDYDRATQGTPRPRTMETFCPRFTSWHEQQTPSPAPIQFVAPSEPIPDYGDDFIVYDENGMYVGRGQAAYKAYYGEKS